MPSLHQHLWSHLRFRGSAYLVLLIALVPTLIGYWRVETNARHHDQARFEALARSTADLVHDELERFVADVRAFSSLFESTVVVNHREWNTFIDTLGYARRHPGVRSVGYADLVTPDQLAAFNRTMRRRLGSDYEIFPPTTNVLKFPTVQLRQFPTNSDVRLGWDSYSDVTRRAALDTVLKTAGPAVTSKMTYRAGTSSVEEGFTVFVPVFKADGGVRGVIFSAFIPQQLFNAISDRQFSSAVSVQMFDGAAAGSGSLLAVSRVTGHPVPATFSEVRPVRLLDRTFQLRVTTLPAFDEASDSYAPKFVLAGGLAFSLLLFVITWRQGSARTAAEKFNRRLRDSEDRLRAANVELEDKITEARRVEGLLAYERDLLATLLEHSPDAIYFKDRESRFIKCGRAVGGHLKINAASDAAGKTDFDFFTAEHARPAFELEQEIIRTGQPVVGLVEKETWGEGHETWVLTSKMPLRDKHGNIIGTFGISKDITKLKATEVALEKEKELLAVTLRSIGDGVITTDVDGHVVLFNQVAERLTGWTQAEAVGRPLKEIFRTNSEETNTEMLRRALHDTAPQPASEIVLVARDDSERNISKTLAPIIDHHGEKIGAVLVFRDITEKLKTEAELSKASKLESIGALAGGIAHDFNNVLTVILGHISLARLAHGLGKPVDASLLEAEKASLRARDLTQRLLTFAKGGAPIKKPLDLSALVRECATGALLDSGVVPEFFFGDDLWTVEADESQIGQVLQNLLSFSRASLGRDPRLDIHVLNQEVMTDPLLFLPPGRYVRVSIRDHGAGLQPEALGTIFEPYFGAKKHGSGLELATAYSIVRKHEGQIRVESMPGQGTLFHVYLPAAVAPLPLPRVIQPRPGSEKLAPRRVLVMDDELPIRTLATLLLERVGCAAATAADGAEAIQLYEDARRRGEPFDAVVMDLTVPQGMGGEETIRRLKALDPGVRAIVSSGYSHDPVMANFRDYGFSGVMPKPYSGDDLAAALEEMLQPAV